MQRFERSKCITFVRIFDGQIRNMCCIVDDRWAWRQWTVGSSAHSGAGLCCQLRREAGICSTYYESWTGRAAGRHECHSGGVWLHVLFLVLRLLSCTIVNAECDGSLYSKVRFRCCVADETRGYCHNWGIITQASRGQSLTTGTVSCLVKEILASVEGYYSNKPFETILNYLLSWRISGRQIDK